MSFEAQRVFLSGKVKALALGFPVKQPGQPFTKPKNAPYGEFHIMGTKPFTVGGEGAGKVRLRYAGMIQFEVYLPEDTGSKTATQACDLIAATFQLTLGRDAAGCVYQFKAAEPMNPVYSNGWAVYAVRVPFTRDEVTTVQVSI